MSRPFKSQWDFGELFPPETLRRVLTVTELTGSIRRLLEREIGRVWVTGEISNLRVQSSGHVYFSLKDAVAQVQCVLFRTEARTVDRDHLRDGQKVALEGELTVYEARGQYQLRVLTVELQGVGALQIAFEKLKQKLNAEGLFAPERKRPMPRYPARIGVVTSPTGAALRDVIHVIQRRNPGLEVIVATCRVQGLGAAEEIASAIQLLNDWAQPAAIDPRRKVDLILVTRGGGSLEDLWAFNEEVVARAIAGSRLPVMSAVGHEIDCTISDFVADFRAATPSAAAEILTEGVFSTREFVATARAELIRLARGRLEAEDNGLQFLFKRLDRVHPRRGLQEKMQRLDDLQSALWRCAKSGCRERRSAWQNLFQRFCRVRLAQVLHRHREQIEQVNRRLHEQAAVRLKALATHVAGLELRLRLLSPTQVLDRGYSITTEADSGKIVRDAAAIRPGQRLRTRLKSGEVRSVAEGD